MNRSFTPLAHRLTMTGLSVLSAAAIAADIGTRLADKGAGTDGALVVALLLFLALAVVLHLATRPDPN